MAYQEGERAKKMENQGPEPATLSITELVPLIWLIATSICLSGLVAKGVKGTAVSKKPAPNLLSKWVPPTAYVLPGPRLLKTMSATELASARENMWVSVSSRPEPPGTDTVDTRALCEAVLRFPVIMPLAPLTVSIRRLTLKKASVGIELPVTTTSAVCSRVASSMTLLGIEVTL
jgi:hypothetical protein